MAAKRKRAKVAKLTLTQKVKLLAETLRKVQVVRFHEPDSDAMEYCAGCGRSPYNVPPHDPGCLVVEIYRVLALVSPARCSQCGTAGGVHREWCTGHPKRNGVISS